MKWNIVYIVKSNYLEVKKIYIYISQIRLSQFRFHFQIRKIDIWIKENQVLKI